MLGRGSARRLKASKISKEWKVGKISKISKMHNESVTVSTRHLNTGIFASSSCVRFGRPCPNKERGVRGNEDRRKSLRLQREKEKIGTSIDIATQDIIVSFLVNVP